MSLTDQEFDEIFEIFKEKSDYLHLYKSSIYNTAKEKGLIRNEEDKFKDYYKDLHKIEN